MDSSPATTLPPALPESIAHRWRRFAVIVKLSGIALLILLLHLPLAMSRGVLHERQDYQEQATREIAGVWGGPQTVTGPVLAVPYTYVGLVNRQRVVGDKVVQVQEKERLRATAFFLPEELSIQGPAETEVRRRGIYETVVYAADLQLSGTFQPDFAAAGIAAEEIQWDRAQVLLGLSDLRGLRQVSAWVNADGSSTAFAPTDWVDAGLPVGAVVQGLQPGVPLAFDLRMALQGSEHLQFAPLGKTTAVTLTAPWSDPSFRGNYLPVRRSVTPQGFTATWETSYFSRGYPQSWTDRSSGSSEVIQRLAASAFGVEFQQVMDGYRLAERAQKYGVLFFVLVFTVFFLFEVTARLRIHPFQYALVGAALCLFFLGFLALSEVLAVGVAYAASATSCTALITLYAWTFLRTGRRALVIGVGLAVTYAYLFFVLQSQDYALLAGTAALFAGLALVMFCTRRLNWYELELPRTAQA